VRYLSIAHHGAACRVTGYCDQLQKPSWCALVIAYGPFRSAESPLARRQLSGNQVYPRRRRRTYCSPCAYRSRRAHSQPAGCESQQGRFSAESLPVSPNDAFKLDSNRAQAKVGRYLKLRERRLLPLPRKTRFSLVDRAKLRARVCPRRPSHILRSTYTRVDRYPLMGASRRWLLLGDLKTFHTPVGQVAIEGTGNGMYSNGPDVSDLKTRPGVTRANLLFVGYRVEGMSRSSSSASDRGARAWNGPVTPCNPRAN